MSTKEQVENLIKKERRSNVWNHFLCGLHRQTYYSGEIREQEILLWRFSSWTFGNFYPLIRVSFNENGKIETVTAELNPFTKMLSVFIGLMIIIVLIEGQLKIVLSLTVCGITLMFFVLIHKILKKIAIEDLRKKIKFNSNNS